MSRQVSAGVTLDIRLARISPESLFCFLVLNSADTAAVFNVLTSLQDLLLRMHHCLLTESYFIIKSVWHFSMLNKCTYRYMHKQ